MKNYNLYPTLLDAIQRYVDSDKTWEKYWGGSDLPIKTQQEYCDECRQELIDKLNRVPQDPSESADKGTCFNELVDIRQEGRPSRNEQIQFAKSEFMYAAEMHNFLFQYNRDFIDETAAYYKGATNQCYLEFTQQVRQGSVHLYGYADKVIGDMCIDLKTTANYEAGKYEGNWQRYVYSLALVRMGVPCKTFRYDVYEWQKGVEPLNAVMFREEYIVDVEAYQERLKSFLERQAVPIIENLDGCLTEEAKLRLYKD